jgi:hypothetical protein
MRPILFLPPDFLIGPTSDFSGAFFVISSNVEIE